MSQIIPTTPFTFAVRAASCVKPGVSCPISFGTIYPETNYGKFFSQMNTYRKKNQFCDVILKVGDRSFPCHRVVLASSSKLFVDFFDEPTEGEIKTIDLNKELRSAGETPIDHESFENVLEYIYCKTTCIIPSRAFDLLVSSDTLEISELGKQCENFLEKHNNIPEKRVFELCEFVYKTNKKQLYEKTVDYIAVRMGYLRLMKGVLTIAHPIFEAIIKHPNLKCPTDDVIDLVVRRQKMKLSNRSQIETTLTHVMSRGVSGVSGMYLTSLIYEDETRLRFRVANRSSPYGISEFMYDENCKKWSRNKEYSSNARCEKNVVINGHLFTLSASWNGDSKSQDIVVNEFQFRCEDNEYQTLAKPPVIVTNYTLTSVYNTIYLYSKNIFNESINNTKFMTKVKDAEKSNRLMAYVYDIDEWFSIPKPEYEVTNSYITSFNNLLYLVGGKNEENDETYFQCYDPRSPKWMKWKQLRNSSFHKNEVACSYGNEIFLLGGGDKSNEFMSTNPINNQWNYRKSSRKIFSPHCLVNYQGTFWAVQNGELSSIVECYDPITNIWTDPESVQGWINPVVNIQKITDAFVF